MRRPALAALALLLPPLCGGCFTSQPSAEAYHDRILIGMDRGEVRSILGPPKDAFPIPGQGQSPDLAVEQWRFQWNHTSGKVLTILVTLGFGLIWMDRSPYGFDVGFGRDGRVRVVSDVLRRPR